MLFLVKELLVKIDDNTYEYLESTAKQFNISVKELLNIYLNGLSILGEVIEKEVEILKEHVNLDKHKLADFVVGRVLTIPSGLYGMVLVLDELIGAWSRGFAFTHGSGRVVDELGNVRGILIHVDSTEVSMEKYLISCIELLVHDEGLTVEFHSAFSFEGFSEDEISKIKNNVKSLLKNMKDRLLSHILKCDESGEVDVDIEEGNINFSITITLYLKKFNCVLGLDLINAELTKVLKESGLTTHTLKRTVQHNAMDGYVDEV